MAYTDEDREHIVQVLAENGPPWNVMSIARLLATVRPVHSVWSYQTYLTKNIDDGAMLRRQVAARKPEKSTGRLLRQRPPRVTRSAPARPPLEEIETTEEESVSSFDELEDDEEEEVFDAAEEMPEPEEPHAPAADSAPDTQEAPDESEEEEINEDLLIQLEARRRQAEPRPASSARDTGAPSAPAEAAHDEAGPASAAERDLLTQKLMDLLVRTGWAPEGSEEDEDVFESAAAAPPAALWQQLADMSPYSANAWRREFGQNKATYLRAARDRFLLRFSARDIFSQDADRSTHSVVSPRADQAPARDASLSAQEADEALGAPEPADESHTPESTRSAHRHTLTPRSVRVGQRREHHDAKVAARVAHSDPDFEEPEFESPSVGHHAPRAHVATPPSASPAARRLPATAPRPIRRTSLGRTTSDSAAARPLRRPRLSAPSRRAVGGWGELPAPWDEQEEDDGSSVSADTSAASFEAAAASARAAREAYLRAQYEARVWELCADYGFQSPAQLIRFMRPAGGDVAHCRTRVEEYIEMLAERFEMEPEAVVDLLHVQRGDLDQLERTLEIVRHV